MNKHSQHRHRLAGGIVVAGSVTISLNTLTGRPPDRAGRFPPDTNDHAISNFLTSSLVLDSFFGMKLFAIKFSLGIFVLYLKHLNNVANNTIESKNVCKNIS